MAISSCSILPRSAPYVDCIRLGCEPEGASLPAAGQGLRRGFNPSLPSISVGCSLWRQRNGIEGTGKERKEKETSSSVHRPPAALAHPKHTIALPPLPPGCRLCPCLPIHGVTRRYVVHLPAAPCRKQLVCLPALRHVAPRTALCRGA